MTCQIKSVRLIHVEFWTPSSSASAKDVICTEARTPPSSASAKESTCRTRLATCIRRVKPLTPVRNCMFLSKDGECRNVEAA